MLAVENLTIPSRYIYRRFPLLTILQSLVMFIRKRDPRYVIETIDEAKLQASLLAASQSQAARAKASFQENLKDFQTQDWMEVQQVVEEEDDEESEVEEEFECVACRKVYKNER